MSAPTDTSPRAATWAPDGSLEELRLQHMALVERINESERRTVAAVEAIGAAVVALFDAQYGAAEVQVDDVMKHRGAVAAALAELRKEG